jgi:hypothetical protein
MHDDLTFHDFNALFKTTIHGVQCQTICTIESSFATSTKLPLHQNDLWHDDLIFRSFVIPKKINNETINKLTMDSMVRLLDMGFIKVKFHNLLL